MKKRLVIVALLVIGIAILSAGTIAYFTSEDTAHNVITSGGVKIALEEWADEDCTEPYPQVPVEVMPGTAVTKIVTVKNLDADAWVRARFDVIIRNQDGKEVKPENHEEAIQIACSSKWISEGDWYYYADALSADEITEPLFSEVVFDGPSMTDEYQNCTVEVIVYTQAVQSANNGDSPVTAAGWPKE